MRVFDLKEESAKKNGEVTVKSLIENLLMAVERDEIESIIFVAKDKNDELHIGNNNMVQTKTIGLLECGKQMIINDMYD